MSKEQTYSIATYMSKSVVDFYENRVTDTGRTRSKEMNLVLTGFMLLPIKEQEKLIKSALQYGK